MSSSIALKRARNRKYCNSKRGRDRNKIAVRKYISSSKGKRTRKRYANSVAGKRAHRKAQLKYDRSVKGQINQRLWNKGLTESEKNKARLAWDSFDGHCQCCGTKEHGGRGWHLDHKDGKFRGIICRGCSCAAGHLMDDPRRCRLLENYLHE